MGLKVLPKMVHQVSCDLSSSSHTEAGYISPIKETDARDSTEL